MIARTAPPFARYLRLSLNTGETTRSPLACHRKALDRFFTFITPGEHRIPGDLFGIVVRVDRAPCGSFVASIIRQRLRRVLFVAGTRRAAAALWPTVLLACEKARATPGVVVASRPLQPLTFPWCASLSFPIDVASEEAYVSDVERGLVQSWLRWFRA